MRKNGKGTPVTKGHRGYLNKRKRTLFLSAAAMLVLMAGLVTVGLVITHSVRNWFSVGALVLAVPFAMRTATFISLLPFRAPEEKEYERIFEVAGKGVFDTEILVPNRDGASFYFPYVLFHDSGIYALIRGKKPDPARAEETVRNMLRLHQLDAEFRIFTDPDAFLDALRTLAPSDRETAPETVLKEEGVVRAIVF